MNRILEPLVQAVEGGDEGASTINLQSSSTVSQQPQGTWGNSTAKPGSPSTSESASDEHNGNYISPGVVIFLQHMSGMQKMMLFFFILSIAAYAVLQVKALKLQ